MALLTRVRVEQRIVYLPELDWYPSTPAQCARCTSAAPPVPLATIGDSGVGLTHILASPRLPAYQCAYYSGCISTYYA
jgi:hypothetical protein